jgi:hypothetical protein
MGLPLIERKARLRKDVHAPKPSRRLLVIDAVEDGIE